MNNLLLLQRTLTPEEIAAKVFEFDLNEKRFSRIRCPLCKWQPKKTDRWMCTDSGFPEFFFNACYTSWNTFETGGKCPGCQHQWRFTTCLRCHEFSPHADWYAKENKFNCND